MTETDGETGSTRPAPLGPYEAAVVEVVDSVRTMAPDAEEPAWARLDSLTKPPRSLGRLEQIAARVAAIQGSERPSVAKRAIVLAAADHGVVAEGVSAFPQDVTWQMVANFSAGGAAINQIAASAGADVVVYDVGVAADVSGIGSVIDVKVMAGTRNMALGPAMLREECAQAVMLGVNAARGLAEAGYDLLGTGEMGIGNSTAAAALTAVYAGAPVESVVGRGTGLDDDGVARKRSVIERALAVNAANELDALGVLAAVGGLEIAMLAGVVIGSAASGLPVVTDGFISGSATLAAVALCPGVRGYVLPSHLSVEPGHLVALESLDLSPVFALDMRLGEGTGAALAFGLIDAACRMMSGMATFAEAGVDDGGE